MKYVLPLLVLVLTLSFAYAQPMKAPPDTGGATILRIFNWDDYIAPNVLDSFSRSSGTATLYNEYDDNAILDARLVRGQGDFDIVVPTATPYMQRQIQQGLYQPLDKAQIPNLKNLDAQLMNMVAKADPDNAYGIIYQWGTTGILFNPAKVRAVLPNAPTDSLELLFSPDNMAKLQKCGVSMLDSPTEVMPLVFRYLGRDPDTSEQRDYDEAEALLKRIRPYVKYFHSSRYVDDLADGSICVALGWNGDANLANKHAAERDTGNVINYNIPSQGTVVWFDMMAIPKKSTNPKAAHAFINYILQPQVMAEISNYTGYANAVPGSRPYLDKDLIGNGVAYPPESAMSQLFSITESDVERSRVLQRIWTRMRISHISGALGSGSAVAGH